MRLNLVLAALTLATAGAQTIPTTGYQAMEWRNIGPFRGGRTDAVTGVASLPRTFYFGGAGGGVFKTENGGETWVNITDGAGLKTSSVGAIAVAASDANVLYVGMGENTARGVALSHGDGVYKSTDGGRTWKHLGLDLTRAISRVRVHPTNPDVVYVAAQGATYGPSKDRGIYRSKDGGATWTNLLYVDENTGPADLVMDPTNPRILYAAFWDHIRKPWEIRSGGPGSGIYKTSDGGETWQKINTGLPKLLGKIGIAVSAIPDRLYAIVEADPDGGLYRSDNAGKTWTLVNASWNIKTRSWYYMKVFTDPKNADVVWVLNANALKSIDAGKTFVNVRAPHGDHHDLWINPNDTSVMINGNDGGATVSFDAGATWSTQENQPTAQFYRVNTDDRYPYWVYGGQQDNTSVGIASAANGPGISWKDWYPVGGCESAYVAFDPKNPKYIYADCYQGIMSEFDNDTHDTRDVQEYPEVPLAMPSREMNYRYNWNAPIVVSQHDSRIIYHASQKLMMSTDRGRSWKEISPDLTHPDDKTQGYGGGPITNEGAGGEVYDTIFYVAESPKDKNVLWTGSDDGMLNTTRDGGKTWTKVTLPGKVTDAQINSIEMSPHDARTVYVAATRYKYNDFTPLIFKSTDAGQTWELITQGIPAESWARVVREDPARKDLLYAGTETGAYVSFNGGKNWQSLQLNLPLTPVTDLKIQGNDLVAATQGRAFWILDNVTALRQAAGQTTLSKLYQPAPAMRHIFGGGGPGGEAAPAPRVGKNPPAGAMIDFVLPGEGTASIEIRDSAGQLVRKYSTEKGEGATAATLKVKAGMNRLLWDLRYEKPATVTGVFMFGAVEGRMAVPGTYQVRLTAGGQTQNANLELKPDPRVPSNAKQFAEHDKFLSAVDADLDGIHRSVIRLRDVRAHIEDILKRTGDKPKVQASGKALVEKLNTIEDALIQKRTIDMQTVINFPVRLAHHYLTLHNSVDGAPDGAINEGARLRYADLSLKLNEQKSELAKAFGADLDAFNRQVNEDKVAPVTLPQ
jgi:photosystem II stability/assembly factor-like uncharacterized protein